MNETLYDRDALPRDLAIRFGTSLGISPVCYPRERLLLDAHVDVLGRAAAALGYSGYDPDAIRDAIAASNDGGAILALVPTPVDHKAAAPDTHWMVVTEAFRAPDAATPLRVILSRHRRNHWSPTVTALLLGDAELGAGTREARGAGADEVVWVNLEGAVSCIGAGACIAEIDGRVVTPPTADGAPDSAWRVACVEQGVAVEDRIPIDSLRSATSIACLWPWGAVQAVVGFAADGPTDTSFAARIADDLSICVRP